MELTVQNVYGLLLRSKLLAADEARAMYSRWQDEAKDQVGNVARFASWMVSNKYVTEFQATLLARGHGDGFFLNDYKILERLGKGRMAGVYKAQHRLGQTVAIKVLPPSKTKEAALLARFERESRLAMMLKHPNIVRSFQMGKHGELRYLVMEYLEGVTVEELLHGRPTLPVAEAARIVHQALNGLQHIHERGLVHRDLKPANLMLIPAPPLLGTTLDCTVKIVDIGLGRVFEDTIEQPDAGLTGEGVLLGTPDYMSPEQARDPRQTDIRADIYSLGCVFYHLLTGQPPFPDTNIISQMIRHASEAPKPLRDLNPAVPEGVQQIVNWMLAKEPGGRYPTPERAAQALEVFLATGSPLSSPELDPGMATYLSWLEDSRERDVEPGLNDVPTVQLSMPPVPPSAALGQGGAKPRGTKATRAEARKSKKKRRAESVKEKSDPLADFRALAQAPPPARKPPALPAGGGLTRRDLVVFFAGVGGGLAAYFLGRGIATGFGRRPKDGDGSTP